MTFYNQDLDGIIWQRSGLSTVEVAFFTNAVLVRSAENPDVVLKFTPLEWKAFVEGAKNGEFDI